MILVTLFISPDFLKPKNIPKSLQLLKRHLIVTLHWTVFTSMCQFFFYETHLNIFCDDGFFFYNFISFSNSLLLSFLLSFCYLLKGHCSEFWQWEGVGLSRHEPHPPQACGDHNGYECVLWVSQPVFKLMANTLILYKTHTHTLYHTGTEPEGGPWVSGIVHSVCVSGARRNI